MSSWIYTRYLAQRAMRAMRLNERPKAVVRFFNGSKTPKLKSFNLTGLKKVMPRMFRRGFGLGAFRKKRRNRRRIGYRRKTQNKVHSFVRWCDKDTQFGSNSPTGVISETGSDQHQSYEFRLSNLVNVSDFSNLYDMYKINKIQLMLEPVWQSNGSFNLNLNIQSRKIRVVHDYNSNNVLANEDDYLEYSNCKSYSPLRLIKITLYPKINNKVEGNLGTDAYTSINSNKVWLDMGATNVPHQGIKIFIPEDISNVEQVPLFKVRAKYWISCKNSK